MEAIQEIKQWFRKSYGITQKCYFRQHGCH